MRGLRLAPFGAALVLLTLTQADLAAGEEDQVERGQYLVRAGGCFSCHTAKGGEKLAGGRPLTTPFGTFYSPNITPDPDTGIGRWADAQFLRACAMASAQMVQTISRCSRIRASPGSPTAMPWQ